jgi:hypothetical protein
MRLSPRGPQSVRTIRALCSAIVIPATLAAAVAVPAAGAHPALALRASSRASQASGRGLTRERQRQATVAGTASHSRSATAAAARRAPVLAVAGDRLTWTQNPHVDAYVLLRAVAGRAPQYSVIHGTTATPAPVPGDTVDYMVRTSAGWSAWSDMQQISYPAPATPSAPSPGAPKTPTTPVPPEAFSPQAPAPDPAETEAETEASETHNETNPQPAAGASNFQPGLVSGTNMNEDLRGAVLLGAKVVRIGFSIATTTTEMEPVIAGYAAKGIRVQPLAEFYARTPSPTEAHNLAGWARAFGPGGTFWANHAGEQLAIEAIEFGNETASEGQYDDRPGEASFQARAETYALRFKEAAEAISATGMHVGLLAQDEDTSGDWMNAMYKAVPGLTNYVAGWTIHPYGGEQYNRERLDALIAQTAAHGASAIPVDITEWGVSTDNGDCVNFNEGFNLCMSYEEAAQVLKSTVAWIRKLLGNRLGDFFLYQVRDQRSAGSSSNCQYFYGVLQHELQPKGAYTTAAQALLSS